MRIQSVEIFAVPKHDALQIAMRKQCLRGYVFFQNLHQHEVCAWLEQVQILVRAHGRVDQIALREYAGTGFLNIRFILQHGGTGSCCQTGNAVRRCGHVDDRHICFVVHDRIRKP